MVREALNFTPRDPRERASEISKAFGHFDYSNSPFLVNAGIKVNERPEIIRGHLLPSPSIIFAENRERQLVSAKNDGYNQMDITDCFSKSGRPGVWDVMRQRLFKPAGIPSWVVIDFANIGPDLMRYFVDELMKAMRSLGKLYYHMVKEDFLSHVKGWL